MAKDTIKIYNLSQFEIVKKDILFIRLKGQCQYLNCSLKLYKNTSQIHEGKLLITKVINDKESENPLYTVNSSDVIHIREPEEPPNSICIESTNVSFVMFNESKESHSDWLKSFLVHLLPKSKDETGPSVSSCPQTPTISFRVEILNNSDIQSTEKDLILEIQDKNTFVLKSKQKNCILETWKINEIKSFKFNEDLFKISVGRQRSYDEAKKNYEFRISKEEKRSLKQYLSDILNRRKGSSDIKTTLSTKPAQLNHLIQPALPISTPSKHTNVNSPPLNVKRGIKLGKPPDIPSPPRPIGARTVAPTSRSEITRRMILQTITHEKIIPSSEEYEEPYPELFENNNKPSVIQKRYIYSQTGPRSEENEPPQSDYIPPKVSCSLPDKLKQHFPREIIIPSSEEYEEPTDIPEGAEIAEAAGRLPKQPEHLGFCGVFSRSKEQRRSMRLDRYPGPKNGDLYTQIRRNSIKHFLHNIVRHKT